MPGSPAEVRKAPGKVKKVLRAQTALYPLPAVVVSTAGEVDGLRKENLITLAWCGIACSEPPGITIAVRKSRFSHGLITSSGEFVVNVARADQVRAVDLCGNASGREVDKWALAGLTPAPGSAVKAPIVAEFPVAMECRLRHTYEAGSHDLFVGEIVAVQVDEDVLDDKGKIDLPRLDPLCYGGGHYWKIELDKVLGAYGYSSK